MKTGVRLEQLLVERGLASDVKQAQALILAGRVRAPGVKALSAGTKVPPDQVLETTPDPPFVSRGGQKLQAALDHFRVSAVGRRCVDVGASTGGFTDCLLKSGGTKVWAVDVGRGQLDWTLRKDPRVVNREKTHVLRLTRADVDEFLERGSGSGGTPPLVTVDVSFLSLKKVIPALARLFDPGTEAVVLVKPQFEVPAKEAPGGVVKDPVVRRRVVDEVEENARSCGWTVRGLMESPLTGPEGNVEFLLYLER